MTEKESSIWSSLLTNLKQIYLGGVGDKDNNFILSEGDLAVQQTHDCFVIPGCSTSTTELYLPVDPIDGAIVDCNFRLQYWLDKGQKYVKDLQNCGHVYPIKFGDLNCEVYGNLRNRVDFLGKGGYGYLYLAQNCETGELTAQKHVAQKKGVNKKLRREADIYDRINSKSTSLELEEHVPGILCTSFHEIPEYLYGSLLPPEDRDSCNTNNADVQPGILVMPLLGEDTNTLQKYCGGRFGDVTVARLAIMLIRSLQHIHGKGVVHRDIKPSNLMMGCGDDRHQLHLIDFGLAEEFDYGITLDSDERPKGAGTDTFMSTYTHAGNAPRPWDDLQSAAFTIADWARGQLPWDEARLTKLIGASTVADPIERDKKILALKKVFFEESIDLREVPKGCPWPFNEFYCRTAELEVDVPPDYDGYVSLFQKVLDDNKVGSAEFDWHQKWKSIDAPQQSTRPIVRDNAV